MNNEATDLQKLRETLNNLNQQSLPRETDEVLRGALLTLDSLEKRLRESEEQSRLLAFYQVSQSVGATLNLDSVLNQVMDAVIALTGAERGFLMLHNPHTNVLDLQAARNFEKENLDEQDMEISRTIIDSVLKTGQGIVTTNAQNDPRFNAEDSVVLFALRSILCSPLRIRGKNIGVVYVDSRIKQVNFTENDLELLSTFAVQAAMAIDNAQLYTRTDKDLTDRIEELERLTRINQELNARLDMEYIAETTHKWALEGTGGKRCSLVLSSQENPGLSVVVGPYKGQLLDPVPPIVKKALDDLTLEVASPKKGAPALMVAPIQLADQSFGALLVEGEEPFSKASQVFLARLATRAASAIENARLYEAVQYANNAKSKFVSVVSHELRLPMTSIKGYTDLILQGLVGDISDQQREFLNVIRNNVERMSTLVSDLSDISRMETGRLRLELAPISLKDYLIEVINSLRPKFEERQQTVVVQIPDEIPMAYADPNRVIQILTNLISNAWKYTPDGGEILVQTQKNDEKLQTSVKDTGLGISQEDQIQLFKQFFRSEQSAVREQPGWGLGLNVTKNLVELMGGEIGFSSKLGEGSTFWFTLPIVTETV